MNKLLTLTAAMMAGSAAFAGTPIFVPEPLPPIVQEPIQDWSGLYVGVQAGYGTGTIVVPSNVTAFQTADGDGFLYGVHLGYNFDLGNFVLGAEIDYNLASITFEEGFFGGTETPEITDLAHLKARVGYDLGSALVYGVGGIAAATIVGVAGADTDTGYFAGLGAEYRIGSDWSVGAEYLFHQFEEFDDTIFDLDLQTIQARVSYHF